LNFTQPLYYFQSGPFGGDCFCDSDHLADEWTDPGLTEKRIHELATYQSPHRQ